MTFFKLSLRNACRQARDYLIYFVTIVLTAALIYAFNGLVFSSSLRQLSQMMATLPLIIVLASIVVICIIGWLISYATNFMLSRRSRELGMYILIGLRQEQVARLFLLENLIVGGVAFLLGTMLGNLLFQALQAIILALFERPYHFSLAFSAGAWGLTFLYFLLIYLFALWRSRKRILSLAIADLLYLDRQNEEAILQNDRKRGRLFILSLVLGAIGTILLIIGNLYIGIIGSALLIVFLYTFFLSFSAGITAYFTKHPAQKYAGENLLVFRNLASKLSAMGIVMATISLLFTATLLTEGAGLTFSALFQNRAEDTSCFDLFISYNSTDDDYFDRHYRPYVEENIPVVSDHQYTLYRSPNDQMTSYLKAHDKVADFSGYHDTVLSFSDYAALREMMGYPPVALEAGTYIIHCRPDIRSALKAYDQPLTIAERSLMPGTIHSESFSQYLWYAGNGFGFTLIVDDTLAATLTADHQMYAAQTAEPVSETDFEALWAVENHLNQQDDEFSYVYTRANAKAEAASASAIFVFPLYYLALVLTMTAATILTIQQLSETDRYKRQFQLLHKLGMPHHAMRRALRQQFTIYYTMPILPPLLIAAPIILHLGYATEPGILIGTSDPRFLLLITYVIFLAIYVIYIIIAYTTLKRTVLPNQNLF